MKTSTALTATILSSDSDLLRESSWWLGAFGYRVYAVRDAELLRSVWQGWQSDFLIVDADHPGLADAAELPTCVTDRFTYRVLLRDANRPCAAVREMEHAFDDAIVKPLNYGEALARLRAGARYVEAERRHQRRAIRDAATGRLTRRGLVQSMQHKSAHAGSSSVFSILLIGIDFYDALVSSQGQTACDEIATRLTATIDELVDETALIGRIAPSVLAVAQMGQSAERCEKLAVSLRDQLASRPLEFAGRTALVSASYCVASWRPHGESAGDVLRDAERTLQHANTMGGATICHSGEFDAQFSEWTQANVQSGVALAELCARDVMTPFVLSAQSDSETEARQQAVNSGANTVAMVDESGKFSGLVELGENGDEFGEPETQAPYTVREDTAFAEIVEKLTTDEQQVVVLSNDESPLGVISCTSMASLLEPVYVDTFREPDSVLEESAAFSIPAFTACDY